MDLVSPLYLVRLMGTTAKIQHKGQVTIPTRVREQAGLSEGDLVEVSFQRGKIVITPKVAIDGSNFPSANDEYTPEQRRIIDARLDQADADIRAGRVHGPFETHQDMIRFLHEEVKKANKAKHKGR